MPWRLLAPLGATAAPLLRHSTTLPFVCWSQDFSQGPGKVLGAPALIPSHGAPACALEHVRDAHILPTRPWLCPRKVPCASVTRRLTPGSLSRHTAHRWVLLNFGALKLFTWLIAFMETREFPFYTYIKTTTQKLWHPYSHKAEICWGSVGLPLALGPGLLICLPPQLLTSLRRIACQTRRRLLFVE